MLIALGQAWCEDEDKDDNLRTVQSILSGAGPRESLQAKRKQSFCGLQAPSPSPLARSLRLADAGHSLCTPGFVLLSVPPAAPSVWNAPQTLLVQCAPAHTCLFQKTFLGPRDLCLDPHKALKQLFSKRGPG